MRERCGPLGVVPSGGESSPGGPVHIETGIWRLPSGRFTAYVYHRGQDVYVGCFGTFAEASDARTARLSELRGGRPVVGRRRVAKLGVAEFLRSVYLPFANGQVRPSTARANTSRSRKWVEPFWAKIVFADVTYDTCVRFRTHLAEGGSSGQTQREAFCLLRAALAEAVRRGYLAANPATEIELPKRRATRVHVPKPALADAVVAAITAPVPHMLASFLRLTGVRINEALALTWDDLDLDASEAHVTKTLDQVSGEIRGPKTDRGNRTIDLHANLVAELRAYRAGQEAGLIPQSDPWVFPSSDGGTRPLNDRNFVQRFWDPALAVAGARRFTPHALRHLWASAMLQSGAPIAYVSEQLGHENAGFTLKQYTRFLRTSPTLAQGYLHAAFGSGPAPSS